jgi:hypothetical protein
MGKAKNHYRYKELMYKLHGTSGRRKGHNELPGRCGTNRLYFDSIGEVMGIRCNCGNSHPVQDRIVKWEIKFQSNHFYMKGFWKIKNSQNPEHQIRETCWRELEMIAVRCSCDMGWHPVEHRMSAGDITGFEAIVDDTSESYQVQYQVQWGQKF